MASIPDFPTLYGEASTGKSKQWSVRVEARDGGAAALIATHGYVGGAMQVNERLITEGKNIGKKNETTPLMQAISEAQSAWNKKRDAKYRYSAAAAAAAAGGAGAAAGAGAAGDDEDEDDDAAAAGEDGVPHPMLAHDYNKRGKSIRFPCYAQRKLDGVRCVAISGRGLFSRNGKPLSAHLTAIRAEVDALPAGTILDGELYSDELSFQEIVGIVKKGTLKAADHAKLSKMYLCVYDTIRDGETNKQRKKWLDELFASRTFGALRLLPTSVANSEEDVKFFHSAFVAEGYEGLILRNVEGKYAVGHRSADLQKYKEFLDQEFRIIGFREGDGVEKGCVLWVCTTDDGKEFDCRPRGTREERATLFRDGAANVGKRLSVRFQEWTDDKKPRFPVGLAIRDYE